MEAPAEAHTDAETEALTVAFQTAADAVIEDVWEQTFGPLGEKVKKLMVPQKEGTIRPPSDKEMEKKIELWSKDEWPFLANAISKFPTKVGSVPFNAEDFLTRIKRHRGSLERSTAGVVTHKANWKELVAKEVRALYGCTLLYAEQTVSAFEDTLTSSRNAYQAAWRKKSKEAAKRAREEEAEALKKSREDEVRQRAEAAAAFQADLDARRRAFDDELRQRREEDERRHAQQEAAREEERRIARDHAAQMQQLLQFTLSGAQQQRAHDERMVEQHTNLFQVVASITKGTLAAAAPQSNVTFKAPVAAHASGPLSKPSSTF